MDNLIKGLTFLSVIGLILVSLVIGLYVAWGFSILWGWFILPLGVKAIGVAHAWGLIVIFNMFWVRTKINFAEGIVNKGSLKGSLFKGVGITTGALIIGWIITFFM